MKAEYAQFFRENVESAVSYIQESHPWDIFSNIVTAYAHGNRRSVYTGRISDRIHSWWLKAVMTNTASDFLYASLDELMRAQFPKGALKPNEEAPSGADKDDENVDQAFLNYQILISNLTRVFKPIPDYGKYLTESLVADSVLGGTWTKRWVMLPGLAYGRAHLSMPGSNMTANGISDLRKSWHVPGLNTAQADAQRKAILRIDQPRWSMNILPKLTRTSKIEGHSPTDRPDGEMLRQREFTAALAKPYYLLSVQSSLHWIRHCEHWQRHLCSLVLAQPQLSVEIIRAVETRLSYLDMALALPVHDFIDGSTSGLASTSAVGHYGLKPVIHVPPLPGMRVPEFLMTFDASADIAAGREFVLKEFVADLLADMEMDAEVNWRDLSQSSEWHSFGQFIQAISQAGIFTGVKETAGLLGWSPLKLETDEISNYGADFVLSDGQYSSKKPGHVIYGFAPVLGFNNRRAYPLTVEHYKNWNTAPPVPNRGTGGRIEWSVCCVKGHLRLRTAEQIERTILPSSASMGEDGVEQRWMFGRNDETARAVRGWYTAQSPKGYLAEWYPRLDKRRTDDEVLLKLAKEFQFWQRDWDAVAETDSNPEKMQETYLSQFPESYVREDRDIQLAYKPDGFYLRFPVKMTREPRLLYFTPWGEFLCQAKQMGYVEVSGTSADEINLSHDLAALDAIVNIQDAVWNLGTIGGITEPRTFEQPEQKVMDAPQGVVSRG
jgi:hypothetical protein